jgi:hypothetical protein
VPLSLFGFFLKNRFITVNDILFNDRQCSHVGTNNTLMEEGSQSRCTCHKTKTKKNIVGGRDITECMAGAFLTSSKFNGI